MEYYGMGGRREWSMEGLGPKQIDEVLNTLAMGYGDFRTSVAKRRRRATEISVFP